MKWLYVSRKGGSRAVHLRGAVVQAVQVVELLLSGTRGEAHLVLDLGLEGAGLLLELGLSGRPLSLLRLLALRLGAGRLQRAYM